MKPDRYELFARICPALLTGLPIFIFYHFFINPELSVFIHSVLNLKLLSELPISLAILFCFYQVNRILGKILESYYFDNEKKFPTTNVLLYCNNKYSDSYKQKLRHKIKTDFKLALFDYEAENKNSNEARKAIIDACRLIRNKVKNGRLVINRNIEYGFIRNLLGGCLLVVPFSLFGVYFFSQIYLSPLGTTLQALCLILSLIFLITSYPLLKFLGNNYADSLYQEYLN